METIVGLLTEYRLFATFVGSFFFGDSVIITVAYLAGQLAWPVVPVFLAAFTGAVGSDILWFLFGVFLKRHGHRIRVLERQRAQAAHLLGRLTGEHPHMALVYIKFLYGARIAMILYVAIRGISFRDFMIYNSLGILAWFAIFFPAGYLAGLGIARAFPFVGAIETGIIVLIVSFIVVRAFNIWVTRHIEKGE